MDCSYASARPAEASFGGDGGRENVIGRVGELLGGDEPLVRPGTASSRGVSRSCPATGATSAAVDRLDDGRIL